MLWRRWRPCNFGVFVSRVESFLLFVFRSSVCLLKWSTETKMEIRSHVLLTPPLNTSCSNAPESMILSSVRTAGRRQYVMGRAREARRWGGGVNEGWVGGSRMRFVWGQGFWGRAAPSGYPR